MPSTQTSSTVRFSDIATTQPTSLGRHDPLDRKPPTGTSRGDSLLTVDDVARATQCQQGLGVGSLIQKETATSRDPHGRRRASV
jgi:hypothetical protein